MWSLVLFLILNDPGYSELIAVILSQCQLSLLAQHCSSPADSVCMLAPVISIRSLSDIIDASGAVETRFETAPKNIYMEDFQIIHPVNKLVCARKSSLK